jgi:hypothetical protein
MAESTTTHETGRTVEQWKCKACAEVWDIAQGDSVDNGCPECRGPLRCISRPLAQVAQSAEQTFAISSDARQWPHEIVGDSKNEDVHEDTGESLADVVAAFLAAARAPRLIHLEHSAAD